MTRQVRFVPGWDCHGLPIELKVLQSMKTKEREQLTPLALRKRAAEYAQETMGIQVRVCGQRQPIPSHSYLRCPYPVLTLSLSLPCTCTCT